MGFPLTQKESIKREYCRPMPVGLRKKCRSFLRRASGDGLLRVIFNEKSQDSNLD